MFSKRTMNELNRLTPEEFKASTKSPIVLVLDNIRSQNNVGSIFRTADAFRLSGIFLCGITATPPHREINKTALGATESVQWSYHTTAAEAIHGLKAEGYTIIAVEQTHNSTLLSDFYPVRGLKAALVFGNEVNGIGDDALTLADHCIEIPQFGTKHSLNIAVTVGIVIWEFSKKIEFF